MAVRTRQRQRAFRLRYGVKWETGSGPPSVGGNIPNDLYLDESNGDVYKMGASDWGSPIMNLVQTLPTPALGHLGGAYSLVAASNQFLTGLGTDGNLTRAQPAFSDLSGAITLSQTSISATSRILGRKTSGSGVAEECTLSEILDFVSSAAQGDILYRGSSTWTRLGAGTSGWFLKTQGAAANPTWAAVPGGGDLLASNNLSELTDTASTARTNLGLGTAATKATGTSGTTVPLLDGTNTWSGKQTITGVNLAFSLEGTTTGLVYQRWQNTGGNTFIGRSNSAGGGFVSGDAAYSFGIVNESAHEIFLATNNTGRLRIGGTGDTSPFADNTYKCGTASYRWTELFAAAGTINTSDQRDKTEMHPIPRGLRRAIKRIIAEIGIFQWKEAAAKKGREKARWHVGVYAQRVEQIFKEEGEDAHRYGLFCEDKIDGERGEMRLSLRHDQLIMLALSQMEIA